MPGPCPGNADAASGFGSAFSQGMLAAGLLPAAKHFPGHGSVTVDSHAGLPVQGASLDQLRAKDLKPFQAAIDAGLPMVMTGHIAVPGAGAGRSRVRVQGRPTPNCGGWGSRAWPSRMRSTWARSREQYPNDSAAPLALAAGADLLLMPANVEAAHAAIVAAVAAAPCRPNGSRRRRSAWSP